MQILELAVGESCEPAAGVTITVLGVGKDGARLKVEASAEVVVTVVDAKDDTEPEGTGKVLFWPA